MAASLAGRSATQQFNLYIYFGAAVFADKAPDLQTLGLASTPNQADDTSGTVGDINGDGFSDVAMFHANLTGPRQGLVRIYLGGKTPDIAGDGDISFTDLSVVDGPFGDVDGDGYDDVLLNSGGYGILRGGPTVPTSFTVIDAADTVSLSGFDINGDGWNDILLSGANGLVLGGPSPMTTAGLTGLTADSTARALTWADYNGDGRVDFADGDSSTAGVFLLLNDGTLNPVPTAQLPAPAVSPYALTGIIATGH